MSCSLFASVNMIMQVQCCGDELACGAWRQDPQTGFLVSQRVTNGAQARRDPVCTSLACVASSCTNSLLHLTIRSCVSDATFTSPGSSSRTSFTSVLFGKLASESSITCAIASSEVLQPGQKFASRRHVPRSGLNSPLLNAAEACSQCLTAVIASSGFVLCHERRDCAIDDVTAITTHKVTIGLVYESMTTAQLLAVCAAQCARAS